MNPTLVLPEPGQLVDVRRRRYVVVDVTQDPLAVDALKAGGLQPQHLVTLSSVEDDALGEDLQVIWEIEPGATAIHKTPLPEAAYPHRVSGSPAGAVARSDARQVRAGVPHHR